MKTLSCDLCEHEESSETFEGWMMALIPHYGAVHAEVMQGKAGLTDEEKKTEMQKWMTDNRARFEAA